LTAFAAETCSLFDKNKRNLFYQKVKLVRNCLRLPTPTLQTKWDITYQGSASQLLTAHTPANELHLYTFFNSK